MKQIQTINLSAMQNEEAFGFFTLVKEEMDNLPADPGEGVAPLKDVKAAYIEKLGAYDEALETSNKLDSVQTVEAWGASYAYSKAMARHPNSMIRNAALPYVAVYEKYGNPTKLAQVKELGVLQNLLTDLEALEDDETIGFTAWREYIAETTGLLMDAMNSRTDEQSRVQVGLVKETRLATEAAYRDLVGKVNVVAAYEGDAAYATFIDHMNALIDRQKAILKGRTTRNKNKEKKA